MKLIANCLWCEWDAGSSLFFWKWPQLYQAWDRGGKPNYAIDNLTQFFRPQDPSKTEEDRTNMKNKVGKVRKRMYIETGTVLSLTHIFYVRKGLNDILMVYNGTSCGLNLAIWAPHFGMQIFYHTICALLPGYSQYDMDVGEMFLNYPSTRN